MGQYMRTALITEFRVSKSLLPKKMDADALNAFVQKYVVDNPQSFVWKEDGDSLEWQLKDSIRRFFLAAFVKQYYADFYGSNSKFYAENCQSVIDCLASGPTLEQLEEWDGDDTGGAFRIDEEGSRDIVVGSKKDSVPFSSIQLSCEGKVMYEELDNHLRFFERALRKMYGDSPLGGGLTVEVY